MIFRTFRMQTALALLVAAALPQIAQSAGYKPFETDFGRTDTTAVAPDTSYKPFVTDFARTGTSAAAQLSPAAVQAMGARYQAMADAYANRPAASHYSQQALDAMGQRYQAQVAASDSTTSGYVVGGRLIEPGQPVTVDEQPPAPTHALRPDDRAGIRGVEDTPVATTASASGFDWTDASIGAASGLGLSLLLVGGLVLGLSTRRQHKVAPV